MLIRQFPIAHSNLFIGAYIFQSNQFQVAILIELIDKRENGRIRCQWMIQHIQHGHDYQNQVFIFVLIVIMQNAVSAWDRIESPQEFLEIERPFVRAVLSLC